MAPSFVKSTYCEPSDFMSKERFDRIFPDEPGVGRGQFVCRYTTMGVTSIKLGLLVRATKKDGVNYKQNISFPVADIASETAVVEYLLLDQLMYLFAPLLFAYMLFRKKFTFGKRLMGLKVVNGDGSIPSLRNTIKREYIKGLPFVILGIYGFYELRIQSVASANYFEESVKLLRPLTEMQAFGGLGVAFAIGILLAIALIWFLFASFIRWRGRTYWDRWTGLIVTGDAWLRPSSAASARSQTNLESKGNP